MKPKAPTLSPSESWCPLHSDIFNFILFTAATGKHLAENIFFCYLKNWSKSHYILNKIALILCYISLICNSPKEARIIFTYEQVFMRIGNNLYGSVGFYPMTYQQETDPSCTTFSVLLPPVGHLSYCHEDLRHRDVVYISPLHVITSRGQFIPTLQIHFLSSHSEMDLSWLNHVPNSREKTKTKNLRNVAVKKLLTF